MIASRDFKEYEMYVRADVELCNIIAKLSDKTTLH
jgi:hypothetical protein